MSAGGIENLGMKVLFRRSLMWPTICTVVLFGTADANATFLLFALLGVISAWVFSVRPQRPLSRSLINMILILVLSIAALVMLRSGIGVSTFAIFAAMLLVVKLFDLHTARDDSQVLVLLISLVVASVLTSNSLLTGGFLIVTLVVILRAVLRFHLYAAAERAGAECEREQLAGRWGVDLRSFQIATMFLICVMGTAVFLIMPRNLGSSVFGDWGGAREGSVTGFNDQVELGRPGLISQSAKPVLDLQVFDTNGNNIGSADNPAIYLRGAVLTSYQGGRWIQSDLIGRRLLMQVETLNANESIVPSRLPKLQGWEHEYRISMNGSESLQSALFIPWMPIEFRSPGASIRVGYDKSTGKMVHDGLGSSVDYHVRTVNPEFLDVQIPQGYARPRIDSSGITAPIARFAAELLRDAGVDPDPSTRDPREDSAAVRILEKHLQAKFTYSLDLEPVPPNRDATEWFLLDQKEGHCEYYASALVLMIRSIGIDARVVTGYVASDFNELTLEYIVRESNAHAWVEAEIAPMKWLTFDGTPRADFQELHVPKPGLMHAINRWYQTVEYAWVKGVIGYDSQSRKNVFGDISPDLGLLGFGSTIRNRIQRSRSRILLRASLIAVVVFGLSFLTGMILIRYRILLGHLLAPILGWIEWIRQRFRVRPESELARTTTRLERAISSALDTADVQREPWMPLRTVISQLPEHVCGSSLSVALDEATGMLYWFRFAPQSSLPESGGVDAIIENLRASEKAFSRHKS